MKKTFKYNSETLNIIVAKLNWSTVHGWVFIFHKITIDHTTGDYNSCGLEVGKSKHILEKT